MKLQILCVAVCVDVCDMQTFPGHFSGLPLGKFCVSKKRRLLGNNAFGNTIFIGGRSDLKWRFSKREQSFASKQNIWKHQLKMFTEVLSILFLNLFKFCFLEYEKCVSSKRNWSHRDTAFRVEIVTNLLGLNDNIL